VGKLARVDEADGGERIQSAALKLHRLSDSLHRGLTASGLPSTCCWLLLDPAPLGVQEIDEPALAELINHHALCRVAPRHAGVPMAMAPALLSLDAAIPADSALIRSSLEFALRELPSPQLAQGGGRVIAAWLECDGEPARPRKRHCKAISREPCSRAVPTDASSGFAGMTPPCCGCCGHA
jgi:hypothetical protein